jgi:hypothetical protein
VISAGKWRPDQLRSFWRCSAICGPSTARGLPSACHSVVGFPKEFNALIRKQHDELRQRQVALLGMRR